MEEAARITSLNENDVLLGRGKGQSDYIGNQRFLSLVETRKEEYTAQSSNNKKNLIANQVFQEITVTRGGRFLCLVNDGQRVTFLVEEGVWRIADERDAIEKVKQALRQRRGTKKKPERRPNKTYPLASFVAQENGTHGGVPSVAAAAPVVAQGGQEQQQRMLQEPRAIGPLSVVAPELSNTWPMMLGGAGTPLVDTRLLLLQLSMLNSQQQPLMQQPVMTNALHAFMNSISQMQYTTTDALNANDVSNSTLNFGRSEAGPPWPSQDSAGHQNMHPQVQSSSLDHDRPGSLQSNGIGKSQDDATNSRRGTSGKAKDSSSAASTSAVSLSSRDDSAASIIPKEEMEALMGLSALSIAGRPKFTEEQEELEQATMTEEERAAALCDVFGKHCSTGIAPKMSKRARRDFDAESIDFLVKQMRAELEQIPANKKESLLEAQKKCDSLEFSDKRLEQFLRCEGMNAKHAAQRFVDYWTARRQVFGPDKYTMHMTLSEALCDDLDAIESGVLCLLPHLDASGRQIWYCDPHRRSRGQYSLESLIRAFWYVMEVAAQENTDTGSGYVFVVWLAPPMTIWDYDPIYDRLQYLEMNCWPVRSVGVHACCPTGIVMKILRPVLIALAGKRGRARERWHVVPETEILNVLSEYGIFKSHLPTQMGGAVQLDQSKWMANRRAVEMEEI